MEKRSIWQRFGDWLRGSKHPTYTPDPNAVKPLNNSDGQMMINPSEPEPAPVEEQSTALFRGTSKKDQIVAIEDGFNRLVDVLESINDNVSQQRVENERMHQRLENVLDTMETMPNTLSKQAGMVNDVCETLRRQASHNEKINEVVQSIPSLTQQQMAKLGEIVAQLETSEQSQTQLVETFRRCDHTMQGVLTNSSAQATAMHHMSEMLQQSDERMNEMLDRQRHGFWWLTGLVVLVIMATVAAVVIVMMTMDNPASG